MGRSQKNKVNCLGPNCNKKFVSPDRARIRFCPRCRRKLNNVSISVREQNKFTLQGE